MDMTLPSSGVLGVVGSGIYGLRQMQNPHTPHLLVSQPSKLPDLRLIDQSARPSRSSDE